ncbi:hypothetical protein D3C80_1994800 [compost metagenome]
MHVQLGLGVAVIERERSPVSMVDGVADVPRQVQPGCGDHRALLFGINRHHPLHRMLCPQLGFAVSYQR